MIILTYATGQQLEDLIAWSNGVFVIIYLAAMFAAAKLLSKRYLPLILLSCILCTVIGFALAWNMAYAILLMLVLLPILWLQKGHLSRKQAI